MATPGPAGVLGWPLAVLLPNGTKIVSRAVRRKLFSQREGAMVGTSQAEHPSSNGQDEGQVAELALVTSDIPEEEKTAANNPHPDDNPHEPNTMPWTIAHQATQLIDAEKLLKEQAMRLAAANERNELLEAESDNLREENMVLIALLKERGDQLVTANGFLQAAAQLTQLRK